MFRLLTLSLWVAAGFAQTPADLFNKPPADVDQALRARMSEFYQDHVDGKFRQAEALVAEDTKDHYYMANKPQYLGFEIQSIAYSDGYTHAKAIVLCEQYVPFPGFQGKSFKIPTPSYWKVVDGQWYWYIDKDQLYQTPFGKMTPGPGRSSGQLVLPNPEDVLKTLSQQVKADKQAVNLKPGGSDQVAITNSGPGVMSLSLNSIPGVQVTPDHADLKTGETATLTVRAGSDAKPGVINVRVEPINQVIPIQVAIQ